MIKEAIDRIISLTPQLEIKEIGGRKYSFYPSHGLKEMREPTPAPLIVHTLSGIVDYLHSNFDRLKLQDIALHVESSRQVSLYGSILENSFCERREFLRAVYEPPAVRMGEYASVESFIIGLQAYFVQDETTAALMKVVGNIKGEQVQQFSDDGQTQAVTAKAGISTVAVVPVPNPVTLKPFRTFPEIEQPGSMFVFRMKQEKDIVPSCGLWVADNGLWKVEAIQRIAAWLKGKVNVPIIA